MKNICFVTGTRAEYGLLKPLMELVRDDKDYNLQIIVTGMHLVKEFGMTVNQIIEDGFTDFIEVEMLLNSDTSVGLLKSMGLEMISISDAFNQFKPDLCIILGDRFEAIAAAISAYVLRIPIAHIGGGERTEGVIDEGIRHSISKFSYLHFTSTEQYRKRVIQLGETPDRVFNVGGIGIDNIVGFKPLDKEDFEKSINFKLKKKNLLITYHPVTLENETAEDQIKNLLTALNTLNDTWLIFTKANADTNGKIINEIIETYVNENKDKSVCFASLGMQRYLSAIHHVDGVIGNSSSGLIEVPSFKKGTINIGERQKGRMMADSVINCSNTVNSIKSALDTLYSKEFDVELKKSSNPYGAGGASKKIYNIINSFNESISIKKSFFDIDFEIS